MPRVAKTLAERVRDRSFLARRHGGLLAGPLVGPDALRAIQRRWQEAADEARPVIARKYESALQGSDVEHPSTVVDTALPLAEFFARQYAHTKGPAAGQPFRLEAFQERFVEAFERRDEDGLRVFKRGLLGIARGNGKSPLAAGLAVRELVNREDSPDVLLGAAAKDQADVAFRYARGFVETGPLARLLRVGRHEIVNPQNDGVLRKVSADGYLQHGLNPSAVVLDELWAFRTDKQRELFDAVDSAIHKRPDAHWLAISTAGSDRGSLLGRLHAELLTLGAVEPQPGLVVVEDDAGGVLMHWYGAATDADFDEEELWQSVNPASFVTVDALRKQRNSPSMSRTTFGRLHCNAWVASDAERWLPMGRWDELADPASEVPDGAHVYVGADGSRSYDTTAVAWAWRRDDGRVCVAARVFSVRADVPHHVLHHGTIDFADVEGFLLELASRFDVSEVRFDPRFLERSMEVLAGRLPGGVAAVEPYSGAHRLALQALERAVLDGTLAHPGDPAVDEQVSWTGVDRFDNGDVRRIRKLDRARPIDASVALALAVQGATLDQGTSVYDTRGVLVV